MQFHISTGKVHGLNFHRAPMQRPRTRDHKYVVNPTDFPRCLRSFGAGPSNQGNAFQKINLADRYSIRIL